MSLTKNIFLMDVLKGVTFVIVDTEELRREMEKTITEQRFPQS